MMRILVVCSVLILFISCKHRHLRIVEERWSNGHEKIVRYYDERTNELVREEKFYENGVKQSEGEYRKGKRHGVWYYWYDNGQLWSEGEFKDDMSHGYRRVYYPDGKLYYEGQYKKGKTVGTWKFYDKNGRLIKQVVFDDNR